MKCKKCLGGLLSDLEQCAMIRLGEWMGKGTERDADIMRLWCSRNHH